MRRRSSLFSLFMVLMLVLAACGDDTIDAVDAGDDATDTADDQGADDAADPSSDGADTDEGGEGDTADGAASDPADEVDDPAVDAPEDGGEISADVDPDATCDIVADAFAIGPGALAPADAAQTLIDAPEPAPGGVIEALESIVALENGSDAALGVDEIIDRLVGYYSFCPELTETDFGRETDGVADGSGADPAVEELGISCFYKFDEDACAQWSFDDPDQSQAPTEILEATCAASPSRRTMDCAELGVRGFEIDAEHGALNLEIIQAAGARCEAGAETFSNPNLHSLACDYGQISGS